MTGKSILLAVGLVAVFALFLMVTWDISAWMVREPVATVKESPQSVKPVKGTEANTVGQGNEAEGEAQSEAVQDSKTDDQQPAQTGTYEDNWTGSDKPGNDVGLKPAEPANQPAAGDNSAADPYTTDDREANSSEVDKVPYIPPAQSDDPYQGDHREAN